MRYALSILWHDRQRYLPAMLAVTFSALLVALQFGLLLGTFSMVSHPVDYALADVWVSQSKAVALDAGQPVPENWRDRLEALPEIVETEPYIISFSLWIKPHGGSEFASVVGSRLHRGALGAVRQLTPALREMLGEPGTVVVDRADLGRLGLTAGTGEHAQVGGQRVRVVGVLNGLKGLGAPYVFCSLETARRLVRLPPGQVTYILGRCRRPADAPRVVEHLRRYTNMEAFTRDAFSFRSRWHWLVMTGGGIALGCGAVLGLLVGAVVTSQTLHGATAASFREFAVLRSLGVPRWRLGHLVLTQAFWLGVIGIALAIPGVFGLADVAELAGARVQLQPWVLGLAAGSTLVTALVAGLSALRALRNLELATLLR